MAPDIAAIAIDSTELKCFGHGEWHVEKHRINVVALGGKRTLE